MAPYETLYGRPCRSPICWTEVGEAHLLGPELVQETTEKPRRGVVRFEKKGKLSPRFIGPFEILDKIGEVAYRLALPPQPAKVHNVFHVSMLRKYEPHSSYIINWKEINLDEDVTFEEKPVKILDRREKKLRGKTIPLVRVLWRHREAEESTWEREDMLRANYPQLFESKGTN
ncbi:uncharacterized protein LOC114293779 [Camellia sinensis]|uniref:uncharacterized protein LOC114293779 n=1 Tax=Camellia sinensis TaxID=4442 RepID=UPI001036EEA9|nr:uncharacterized protein LOC114293779 [Camellia sinensis]